MKTYMGIFWSAFGCLLLTGCITSHQQATMDATAFTQPLPAIHVMPVIDARTDRSGELDPGDLQRLRDLMKEKLEDKGYQTVVVDTWKSAATTSPDREWSVADLVQQAPPDAKVLMVLTVTNVTDVYAGISTSYSITGTFNAIDCAKGASIWKITGTGSHGTGGIIGSAIGQADKRLEAQTALGNVLSDFPENKK